LGGETSFSRIVTLNLFQGPWPGDCLTGQRYFISRKGAKAPRGPVCREAAFSFNVAECRALERI
jgi:hypothetical protein